MQPDRRFDRVDRSQWHELALARWDNEGGAGPAGANTARTSREPKFAAPPLTNAELVQLQVRVIALESLLIALLSHAGERELDAVRQMATHILPRPGFTPHRLTLHAAAEMRSLVDRSGHFRVAAPACERTL